MPQNFFIFNANMAFMSYFWNIYVCIIYLCMFLSGWSYIWIIIYLAMYHLIWYIEIGSWCLCCSVDLTGTTLHGTQNAELIQWSSQTEIALQRDKNNLVSSSHQWVEKDQILPPENIKYRFICFSCLFLGIVIIVAYN